MKTESERWFAGSLSSHGYTYEFEPDLGGVKRPDFAIFRDAIRAICEVKEFEAQGIEALMMANPGTLITRSVGELVAPVRNQISAAAKQLKPFRDPSTPLIVVLANPLNAGVNLGDTFVISAMYGDISTLFTPGPGTGFSAQNQVGRNGKLTTDHQYVSAVVVVTKHEKNREYLDGFIKELFSKEQVDIEMVKELVEAEEGKLGIEEISYRCAVFETVSSECAPLPETFFDGPHDVRWQYFEGKITRVK
ncbi:MAG TPA: hypothetical protein VMW30_05830 [Candidatus Paceibacterota bacterium]|nr:hypothetical protein [Candidatus Paceibacterota bacterium]